MSQLNPNQRIIDVLADMQKGLYRIPSIQRGYEWDQERVLKLLDSIIQGYPIGALMVWKPDQNVASEIPTRRFIDNFDSKEDYLSDSPHAADLESHLVLDGQQRLESLFLAFFGAYNGMRVYYKLDHERDHKAEQVEIPFEFLHADEAGKRPEMVSLSELAKVDARSKFEFAKGMVERIVRSIEDHTEREKTFARKLGVVNQNIDIFKDEFTNKLRLLLQEVEKYHDYDHVLEIFERVNSGGMVLTKSDLLFSTLKLKLHEMEKSFSDSLEFLNQGDRFNFNTDFLIKMALVVFNKGAKYEMSKLRDAGFLESLRDKYHILHTCLRQTYAWLDEDALIKCDRFLRSRLALIPIIDFMVQSGRMDKPDGRNGQSMRQYLYMSFFLRLYSNAPDSVLDQLHDRILASVKDDPNTFPIDIIRQFMVARKKMAWQLVDEMFADDADLMLNIVDGGRLQIDPKDPKRHPKDLKLEVDHIFPKTPLSNSGLGDVVNHVGNYRLLVMPANRRKLASMPNESTSFFGRENGQVEKLYQGTIKELNRKSFVEFRNARAELIRSHVISFLNMA